VLREGAGHGLGMLFPLASAARDIGEVVAQSRLGQVLSARTRQRIARLVHCAFVIVSTLMKHTFGATESLPVMITLSPT